MSFSNKAGFQRGKGSARSEIEMWGTQGPGTPLVTRRGKPRALTSRTLTYLVWRKGIGRDTHRKGSKVLLCFRQWGHVKDDL